MESKVRTTGPLLLILFLVAVILAVYWPVQFHDFINLDDPEYILENPHVLSGFKLENIIWAFTSSHSFNWHPLTWISHILDCQLYGLNPGGHHLNNLIIHTANAVLLFIILNLMTGTLWRSFFVAAFFALHPLHVESVAWISERKDVLSTFFGMLTILAYYYYTKKTNKLYYIIALLLFAMGLMAKPMLVTLPFVLLLIDYWPLYRIKSKKMNNEISAKIDDNRLAVNQISLLCLFIEKIPFFILTTISSILTFLVQKQWGSVISFENIPFSVRITNAVFSYIAYIRKMIIPLDLGAYYPYIDNVIPFWCTVIFSLVLLGITFFSIYKKSAYRYFFVGWLWYLGTLVPVIGLLQVGNQSMADRYTYVPLIGLFIIITWGLPSIFPKAHFYKVAISIIGTLTLISLTIVTLNQLRYWRNSYTLFEHTLNVTTNNHVAHNSLGHAFYSDGNIKKAIYHFQKAIKIKRYYGKAHYNLGIAYASMGRMDNAIEQYLEALKINKNDTKTMNNLAILFTKKNELEKAEEYYKKAIQLDPDYAMAHTNLGVLLAKKGDFPKAIAHHIEAIRIDNRLLAAHINLGIALTSQGKYKDAIAVYKRALEIAPDSSTIRYHLKIACSHLNDEINPTLIIKGRKESISSDLEELCNNNE